MKVQVHESSNMARTSKSKKGKAVTVQNHPSSEEEQDEGSLPVHRGASHLRTAENMLGAVGSILHVQFLTQSNRY
jgi:hypothetical protein